MLGKGQALANQDYNAYQGPLTAGPSNLQNQAFGGLGSLVMPDASQTSFTPGSFTDPGTAQQYMNPYLQSSLNPQMDEARRQNQIQQQLQNSEMSKAGAFGGSRQAVANSEMDASMLRNMAQITGQGYNNAFNNAQQQYNTEQGLGLQAAQQNQGYGLQALAAQAQGGDMQRQIEQQGMSADQAQFEEESMFPYKQTQYMQSLLQGLPIGAQSYSYQEPGALSTMLGNSGGIASFLQLLGGAPAGDTTPTPTPVVP